MTATLNPTLLNNLQRMIGIRITPPMWIWGSRNRMQRRTVKISINITSTYMRIIRPILIETLSNNLHKKLIIYTNTAKSAEGIRDKINTIFDTNSTIEGDTILIIGDQDPKVKFASAQQFTSDETNNAQNIIDNNGYIPRVLLATSSCIGAGLDSSNVYSVI